VRIYQEIERETKDKRFLLRAWYHTGWAYYKMGKEKKALEIFKHLLKEDSASALTSGIKLWFGEYFYGKGDFIAAKKYFSEVINEFPESSFSDDAAYWLGWVFYDTNMKEEALNQFETIVKQTPKSKWVPQAILALGDIYKRKGEYYKAIPKYEMLIQQHPKNPITRIANNRVGTILKMQDNYALAIEYFKVARGEENSEINAQMQFDIAECYEKMGMESNAVEEYLKVEYEYPKGKFWVTRAHLNCAKLLEKQGKNESAFNLYQKMAEDTGQEAEYAKEKIKMHSLRSG